MPPRAVLRSSLAALLVGVLIPASALVAKADPLPADYSGTTHGDVLALNTTLAGVQLGASLGHQATNVDSTATPQSEAESANLEAGAIGIPVSVAGGSAESDGTPPSDSYNAGLGQVDVPGLLDTGVITGSGTANWAGETQCVTGPIATSTTSLAGADLGGNLLNVINLNILHLGAVSTTGTTSLQGGSVVSASSGNLADLTLLNANVGVHVLAQPTLTATSNGTTGSVTANDYAVSVTVGSAAPVTLHAGGSIPINLNLGVATARLTLSVGQLTNTSSGPTGSGTMTFLRITGSVTANVLGTTLATVDIGLLPLNASATAPTGGVECDALDAPTITRPVTGASTGQTPTITGTGLPGATVTVAEGGTVIGTTTVNADGTWSLTPTDPLAAGDHTISATQRIGTATSDPSNQVTFTVQDTTAPAAPVITTPADGSSTSDNTPTISGTAEPGSVVTVTTTNGSLLGTAAVDGNGNWTLTSPELADGDYTITATATDDSGNTSDASDPVAFTVDTAAPDAPVIESPADGAVISDTTPTISGTGEPGATVVVYLNGNRVGTTTVDGNGDWSVPVTDALADGGYVATATQTDEAGNTSDPATSNFTVDTTPPATPVITTPADDSVTSDPTPTISGTAEPGSTVTVADGDGNVLGTATADDTGAWTFDSTRLTDGTYTITASATDAAGNVSPDSDPVTFTVDSTAPDAPVITGPDDGAVVGDPTPTITGTGEPGATVTVTVDGTVVGTTTVGDDGSWSLPVPDPLDDGDHTVTATQTDAAGNESPASDPVTFTVDTAAPDAPVITSPADGDVTNDPTPTISGTAEPGSTVTVTTGDGTVLGTATTGPGGTWNLDAAALDDGIYTIAATATDEAGNESPASEPVTFTVDTAAPDAPVVTGPADGSTISDSTPTITGTGEPGATITVTLDGDEIGTATVAQDGSWSLPVDSALADGDHTVTATQTDPAGNTSPDSDPTTFTVDTTAAAAPVITTPSNGDVTSDPTPAISGTGEPGSTVTVTDSAGTVLGTAVVTGAGNWSFTSVSLDDGTYTISGTQADAAGNTSASSDPVIFTVDTTSPDAPVITTPDDGSVTGDATPTIGGTGEPGDTVTVVVDDTTVGTATVGGDGTWTLPLTDALADGDHTVTATQTDAAGNDSPASDPVTFTVDTTASAPPVITGPADGSTTQDSTPTITGTGAPGETVTVMVDGQPVGTTTVGDDGSWSFTPDNPLTDADHTVTATQTDTAGNTSDPSDPVTFTVDSTAPDAPVITGPADGSITADPTPQITGTAEPGSTVAVIVDGTRIGTATADGDGAWSLTPSDPLTDGDHTVTARATDPAGNTSDASDGVTFTVDTTAPDAPAITGPADGSTIATDSPLISGTGEPGAIVTITIDGDVVGTTQVNDDGTWSFPTSGLADGGHTVTATQTDAAGNASDASDPVTFSIDTTAPDVPVISSPTDGSTTRDTTPSISGTGEPGATVEVYLDGSAQPIGTATVADDGTWTLDVPDALAQGDHTVTARQIDPPGNVSGLSDPVTFTVDSEVAAPVIEAPTDGAATNDNTPTISGIGEPGATVTVTDSDGNVLGTAAADDNGNWSIDSTRLGDGAYTITATQTDAAGNVSPASDPVTFTVDTAAPSAPVISDPGDGSSTDDNTPTISGTGEAGAVVTVTVDGDPIGTAVVGDDGSWQLAPTDPLADGDHTVTATQTDPAGNTSPASDPVNFTVDTSAPDVPIISGPSDGATISDSTPTITGTGEPGATVTVTDEQGDIIGTTVVAGDGTWSLDSAPLLDGEHTIAATQADAAGNVSPASDPVTFSIDSLAPAPPGITSPADGSTIGDNTPTISGTGEPGATVAVTVDGVALGTATVDSLGDWSIGVTAALTDGAHAVSAIQSDAAGNTSSPTTSTFTVDTTAPPAPVITSPADGSTTIDSTPTISGTAEAGSVVVVADADGNRLGTATAGSDGSWSFDSSSLNDGTYTITASATDAVGNSSPDSDPVTYTVDTAAPDAPVITGPADGSTVTDPTPAITGTGEPGATVEVSVDGTVIGTTTVGDDGSWRLTPSDPLTDGDHTLTATQTDPAGNESPASDPISFSVDSTAPNAPLINTPADGDVTDDPTPVVSGTAEPGSLVVVTAGDGTSLGVTTADADGNWTLDSSSLDDGTYTITASATDQAGNISPDSDPVTFTVDTAAPDAPTVTGPADGSTVTDPTPAITGTGEPGAALEVSVDGTVIGMTTVGDDGSWSLTPSDPLTDGDHTVTATQTDAAGNESPASAPISFSVDSTAPDAPVINTPADGDDINDPTPTIAGTAEPGSTVTVTSSDGTVLVTAPTGSDGTWSQDSSPLPDGTFTITATATDEAGNASPVSDPVTFTVDTAAPDAPTVTGPADGSTVSDTTPAITGTGEPGAAVEVSVDGTVIGTTTVGDDGTWSLTPPDPLPDGDHTVTASQTDAAGNESPASAPISFTVDSTSPDAPVITVPANGDVTTDPTPTIGGTGEPGDTVTVTDSDGETLGTADVGSTGDWSFDSVALDDGTHTITATQTDPAGNESASSDSVIFTVDTTSPAAPVITGPADGSTIADDTPVITGTGEPGATVAVIVDGDQAGASTVGADGEWSLPVTDPLADGDHSATATQTDPAGQQSEPSDPDTFTVDTTAPEAPMITGPDDGIVTTDRTPIISGTGEPGSTVTVTTGDGTDLGTATVDADGNWSLESSDLRDGTYTIAATQSDPAGNVSAPSDSVTFTVDATAPSVPVITDPVDGTTIADDTPTIDGTGDPGSTVTVSVDGDNAGTTTADSDGNWSLPISDPINDGTHTVGATATDAYGNTSQPVEITVTVDTTVAPPVITSPADGSTTADHQPIISGTGEPGATVTVIIDGPPFGTALVDSEGNWTLPVSDRLGDGEHTIAATQTDVAGNTSAASEVTFTILKGAQPVAPPVITSPQPGEQVNDPTPTIRGTGEPGATIDVYQDGSRAGSTIVDFEGNWSVTIPEQTCGEHMVQAVEATAQTLASSDLRTVAVSSQPSAQVSYAITCPSNGGSGGGGNAGGTLPNTGAPTALAPIAGLGFLALLSGLAVLARRRGIHQLRRQHPLR